MDLKKKREELIAELEQMQQRAAGLEEQAATCRTRCSFLRGAIAMINDQIGLPPEALPATPPAPTKPLSRAERRALEAEQRRATKRGKPNGAPAAPGS